jgi:hypothetical protein
MTFLDVCDTYEGEMVSPMVYTDTSETAVCPDPVYTVTAECMPMINQIGMDSVSEGDDVGILGGICSVMISGPTVYMVGSLTVMVGGPPVQRLTSVTGMNCMVVMPNTVGMTMTPSQFVVLVLG